MDELAARCPACGYWQEEAFAHCAVCLQPSRWWCGACERWLTSRECASCGGGVSAPEELPLGRFAVGASAAFILTACNCGKKPIDCAVTSPDLGVTLAASRLVIPAGGATEVRGTVVVPPGPDGPRAFRIQFFAPIPTETLLVLEVVPARPAVAFSPSSVALVSTAPGTTSRAAVPVTILDSNPVLEVMPPHGLGLIAPEVPLSASVQVRNAGIGVLRVEAQTEDPRVTVTPPVAEVLPGPPVRFQLSIPVKGLASGPHESAVWFTGNGGRGRAVVRFRLPVEQIYADDLVDLGDRPAGRPTGGALRVRNTGPDPVTLGVRGEHQWLRPGVDVLRVGPGETTSVSFRLDLPSGVLGPVVSAIWLEGRGLRRSVAIHARARKVVLRVEPELVLLGEMLPGAERAFAVEVMNAGDVLAELRETHATGELEVWLSKVTVRPGERVTLAGRARVNARQTGREVRTRVPLGQGAFLRCAARVAPPKLSRAVGAVAGSGGAVACGALCVAADLWQGVPLALVGLAAGAWACWGAKQ